MLITKKTFYVFSVAHLCKYATLLNKKKDFKPNKKEK